MPRTAAKNDVTAASLETVAEVTLLAAKGKLPERPFGGRLIAATMPCAVCAPGVIQYQYDTVTVINCYWLGLNFEDRPSPPARSKRQSWEC